MAKEERAIYEVSRFFDTLGYVSKVGILKRKLVMDVFGGLAAEAWDHSAFFLKEIGLRQNLYPNNFRRLSNLAKKARFKPYAAAQSAFSQDKIRRASLSGATDEDKTFG